MGILDFNAPPQYQITNQTSYPGYPYPPASVMYQPTQPTIQMPLMNTQPSRGNSGSPLFSALAGRGGLGDLLGLGNNQGLIMDDWSFVNNFSLPIGSGAGTGTTALGAGTQLGNIFTGLPANSVASIPTATGAPGYMLADGSIVPQAGTGLGLNLGSTVPGVAGAVGLGDLFINKRRGKRGLLQGAGSGASLGFSIAGPPGAVIGAILGGALGGGLGQVKTNVEDKRLKNLQKRGIYPKGRKTRLTAKSREKQYQEYINRGIDPNFVGYDDKGNWVNMQWLATGDVSKLKPEDIQGYSTFYELYGKDYGKKSIAERADLVKPFLDNGLIREVHGTLYLDPNTPEKRKAFLNLYSQQTGQSPLDILRNKTKGVLSKTEKSLLFSALENVLPEDKLKELIMKADRRGGNVANALPSTILQNFAYNYLKGVENVNS